MEEKPPLRQLLSIFLETGDRAGLTDYFEQVNHPDAPILIHVSDPPTLIEMLLGNSLTALDALQLPLPADLRLKLVVRHDFNYDLISQPLQGRLACDFAEHVLPNFEAWNPNDLRPRNAIEMCRRWLAGLENELDLFAACHATRLATESARRAGQNSAALASVAAGAAGDEGDFVEASYYARLSAGSDQEIEWQLARIRAVLEENTSSCSR